MPLILWVAAGGALGSALRYMVNIWSGRIMGMDFPWGTLIVNVLGCFIMGVLVNMMALKITLTQESRAFLTVGVLGGFTTFSAFSLDVALLVERKTYLAAAAYGTASVLLSLGAVFAGLALVRSLTV
jgi:fluoride exporter